MKASRANECRGESCQHRTLAAIKDCFESKGLSVFGGPEEGFLYLHLTFYPPEAVTYRNDEGDAACWVIVTASKDGQRIKIFSLNAWNLRDCPHRASVYETLVRSTPEWPIVHFQHDPESDGVTPIAILTVDNREVSGDLIHKGVAMVIDAISRWDPSIRRAMENGEVSVPNFPNSSEELSPDELRRIERGLCNRLTKDVEARWQRVRQDFVAAAGSNGTVTMSEEPHGDFLTGTAAIFHEGRLIGLTRTLDEGFERRSTEAIAEKFGL